MDVTRYDPWRTLDELHREMNRLFDRRLQPGQQDQSEVVTAQWLPAVDVKEEDNRYLLHADIPGVDPKDIEVTMDNGVLTIKGERRYEDSSEGEGYTRRERSYGLFYRRFTLPENADPDNIQARGKHGVLEIEVPKRETQQQRRIAVEG